MAKKPKRIRKAFFIDRHYYTITYGVYDGKRENKQFEVIAGGKSHLVDEIYFELGPAIDAVIKLLQGEIKSIKSQKGHSRTQVEVLTGYLNAWKRMKGKHESQLR